MLLGTAKDWMRAAWRPSDGPGAAALQLPPAPGVVAGDGSVSSGLWTPSEGPCRPEPGGAGGEPNGRALAIRKDCWE